MAAAGIDSDRPRTGSWQLQVRQWQAWSSRKGSRLGYSPQGTLGYTVWTLLTVEEVGAGTWQLWSARISVGIGYRLCLFR